MPSLVDGVGRDWGTKKAWNRGASRVDQSICGPDERRCVRCLEVYPISEDPKKSGFYKDKRKSNGFASECKKCNNKDRDMEKKKEANSRYWRKNHPLSAKLEKGFEVLYDPHGLFPRGNMFTKYDFYETLYDGYWPNGMMVRDLVDGECYEVQGMDIIPIPDRDWTKWVHEEISRRANCE